MAITRTQIAKQLLKKGGPAGGQTGSKGGYSDNERAERQAATRSRDVQSGGRQFDTSTGPISPGTDVGGGFRDDNPFNEGPPSQLNPPPVKVPPPKPEGTNVNKFKRAITKYGPFSYLDKLTNSKLARINNAKQRQNYINSLDLTDPEERQEYLDIMQQLGPSGMDIIAKPTELDSTMLSVPPSMLATNPMTEFGEVDNVSKLGNPGVDDVLGEGYEEYLDRFKTTDNGGGDNQVMDPCKGPNPPAYCFIDQNADDTTEEEPFQRNYRLMADGGRAAFAEGGMPYEGGIMDLETSRQMYGLGKLVKKVTRGVKKIVKSPIGKAALLGAIGFGIPGVTKGFFSKGLMGTKFGMSLPGMFQDFKAFGNVNKALDIGSKAFKLGDFFSNPLVSIGLPTIASYLMTPKEEDQKELSRGADIDDPNTIMANVRDYQNIRLMADGGIMRAGYQEGSKEPVAKKTMPLLDMDGKEKDYRETGGFVEMGRMERADDVPARLSKNEFVFTADAVRNAGDGSVDKGAEVMYNMMKNLESGGEVSEESQGLEGARKMFQTSQRLEEVI
jgi:hypothetical protein